ncbi:EVE domain-containing protein [Candidatus Bealeia paramacronuclearis]|uniref:UPF0310 protein Bealeia1_01098 n=1 Tax=Candidatus Bealeia paramacronuclearis TaxID=1921001 RepID=A0ABZ2C372_9PROT|nr:EVE domain-containing protein [Candidatus Bealeia paramacronuclearis]
MTQNWIGVACRDHVRRGIEAGIMQLCHGREAPLNRIQVCDRIAYYSPTITFGGTDKLQAFTALGVVKDGAPYQLEMTPGFTPFRRDVEWIQVAHESAIHPLLMHLELTSGKINWGYPFRLGIVKISDHDMDLITNAMGVTLNPNKFPQSQKA